MSDELLSEDVTRLFVLYVSMFGELVFSVFVCLFGRQPFFALLGDAQPLAASSPSGKKLTTLDPRALGGGCGPECTTDVRRGMVGWAACGGRGRLGHVTWPAL